MAWQQEIPKYGGGTPQHSHKRLAWFPLSAACLIKYIQDDVENRIKCARERKLRYAVSFPSANNLATEPINQEPFGPTHECKSIAGILPVVEKLVPTGAFEAGDTEIKSSRVRSVTFWPTTFPDGVTPNATSPPCPFARAHKVRQARSFSAVDFLSSNVTDSPAAMLF